MKRFGVIVLVVGMVACEKDQAPAQESKPVPSVAPPAPAAPVDAMPAAVADMKFVPPVDAANPQPEPEPEPEVETKAYVLSLPGEAVEGAEKSEPRVRPGDDLAKQLDDVKATEPVPPGRILVAEKTALVDSSLRVEDVLSKIQSAYMAGLKRCYKDALKLDPTLAGKLTLALTVNETGRVSELDADGPTEAVATCVEGQMKNWRYAAPKDADGEPTSSKFQLVFQLRPD